MAAKGEEKQETTEFDMNWEEGHFHFGGNKPKTSSALPENEKLNAMKQKVLDELVDYNDADFEKPIRIAVVGLGGILEAHHNGMKGIKGKRPLFEITVLCDPNEEQRRVNSKEFPNALVFQTLTEALERASNQFEACLILTPVHYHEPLAIEALKAGKHTFMEKPFAANVEACKRIMDVAYEMEKRGIVFQIGENSEFWPELCLAQRLVAEGAIGKLIAARTYYHEVMAEAPFIKAWTPNDWRWNPKLAGGGCVMDAGTHWLRGLHKLLGYNVESVVCQAQSPVPKFQGETIARSMLSFTPGKYHDGILATFDSIAAGAPIDLTAPWFTFTGTEGEITIDPFFDGGINVFNKWAKYGCHTNCGGYFAAFGPQMIAFGKAIKKGRIDGGHRPENAAAEINVIRSCYLSSYLGSGLNVVKVPNFFQVDGTAEPVPVQIYPSKF